MIAVENDDNGVTFGSKRNFAKEEEKFDQVRNMRRSEAKSGRRSIHMMNNEPLIATFRSFQ